MRVRDDEEGVANGHALSTRSNRDTTTFLISAMSQNDAAAIIHSINCRRERQSVTRLILQLSSTTQKHN